MDIDYQYLVGTLQEALAADGRVNALDLRIAVAGGRIHLTGEVPTEARRALAGRIVAELQPRLPLDNELTVLELSAAVKHEGVHA